MTVTVSLTVTVTHILLSCFSRVAIGEPIGVRFPRNQLDKATTEFVVYNVKW